MRTWRTLITTALIAGAAAACDNSSPTEPGGVAAELKAVRDATWDFHDVNAAMAAGYGAPSGPCDESPAGAMGIHTANQQLVNNPALDPLKPEVLLYLPTGEGKFALVGVEYVTPVLLRNQATGAVAPWFAPGPWPSTYSIVGSTPTMFGETFQGPMPGHVPGMPWHYDLHVWAWSQNPSGTFAQWNPSISCSR